MFNELAQLRARLVDAEKAAVGDPMHNLAVHDAMMSLADMLRDQGDKYNLLEAEELIRKLLSAQESQSGPYHDSVLDLLSELATILESLGKIHNAEYYHQLASSEALGLERDTVLKYVTYLVELFLRHDKYTDAIMHCGPLVSMRMILCGPTHRKTVDSEILLAKCLLRKGSFDDGRERLGRGLALLEPMVQDDSPDPLMLLAEECERMRDFGNALNNYERAYDLMLDVRFPRPS